MITFTAYGTPAPKGSTRAFIPKGWKRAVITETNKHTRPWAAIVKYAAKQAVNSDTIPFTSCPVSLHIVFYLPMPKSLPKRVHWHVKKPDCDKLLRAAIDALTGIIFTDDSQIVRISAMKEYTVGQMPRAEFMIENIEAECTSNTLDQLGLAACGMGG